MCSSLRMRYVAAYLLAVLGGNDKPSESDIKKILSSVGIDADPVCLKKVISELKDRNLTEVIAAGKLPLSKQAINIVSSTSLGDKITYMRVLMVMTCSVVRISVVPTHNVC